ncbi:GspH/FimT family pseudopilin [Halomonas sp.]|uniref:GspH/FimT family pseudopilin n=1 Tax=Halomonas sp. TaxID=1486246 RepID=UPI00298EAB0D|nr:GspH/FimT family pseudopilin [Halomonas sp.]MDW7746179.1 GspH/FimT family pseudopilin [Halomonas sp.]
MAAGKVTKLKGFTLIELLVTIAVIIIMATIAVPSFQNLVASNRFAADYNQILTGLNYARSEAVKRRADVSVVMSASGAVPWKLEVTAGPSGAVSTLRVMEARDNRVAIESKSGDFSVTFNPLGRRENCSDDPCEVTVSYQKSETMEVEASGRINRQ